ncbi:MAG TPA: glycosyltransferase family 4 protein [Patescibacteria group bacterium]|jgi:glycosyltransferase involved in cell wall biosynthesis|nr:glycosyltransferase family 4 protein [Patescibacteria group bacterium]
MKLLMLGWELPPHNSGGLGVACYHMAKAIAHAGVDIDFVLPYDAHHPDTEWMKIHAATLQIPDQRSESTLAYSRSYSSLRKIQASYIAHVEELVQKNSYDVVHAHDWLTMEAGMRAKELTGLPLIVHVHATEFDRSASDSGNPLIHEIEYQGLMMADRIFAVSNITKAIIVSKYGIPADKVEVVHNALDVNSLLEYDYDQRTYRYLETLRDEGYTIVSTVTRFTVQKGLTQLMRAAARACERYDKLAFLFAGDGEQRDELLELAAELGISDKVFFTGFIRGKQWRDAFSVSDVFVMSSVSEPFGLTALEAAHFNNALIISKQSGVGEVLKGIFRYDFWDVDRLADQLIAVATSPALLSSLRQAAKSEYLKLSWNDVATKCLATYTTLRTGVSS